MELLPTFLANCVIGDQLSRFMFHEDDALAEMRRTLGQRLDLCFHAPLRDPSA